jgi:hypothetical protein
VKVVGNVAPRVAVVGAAVMGMAAAGMVGAQAAEVIVGSPVVLVVGDPSALTAGDAAVQADLTETGYDVQVVDDAAPSAVWFPPNRGGCLLGGCSRGEGSVFVVDG